MVVAARLGAFAFIVALAGLLVIVADGLFAMSTLFVVVGLLVVRLDGIGVGITDVGRRFVSRFSDVRVWFRASGIRRFRRGVATYTRLRAIVCGGEACPGDRRRRYPAVRMAAPNHIKNRSAMPSPVLIQQTVTEPFGRRVGLHEPAPVSGGLAAEQLPTDS